MLAKSYCRDEFLAAHSPHCVLGDITVACSRGKTNFIKEAAMKVFCCTSHLRKPQMTLSQNNFGQVSPCNTNVQQQNLRSQML